MTIDPNFQTPGFVCDYIITLLEPDTKTILEPTPGLRNLSGKLISAGYEVEEPLDFFLLDKNKRYDEIVGNPPFSEKSAFLDNAPKDLNVKGMAIGYHILTTCMDMSNNLTMVMPWFTLSDSDVRMRFLKKFGLVSVTPLPRKTFDYARIQTVVIKLRKGYCGQTEFVTKFF